MGAQKAKIRFDSLDKRLIYLVCEDNPFCTGLFEALKSAGFQIQVLRNFNDLYGFLETGRLGFILVSRSVKEAFGDAHLGSFIQRRFRVPIISFVDPTSPAEAEKNLHSSGEIKHLTGGMGAADILMRLTGFENSYNDSLNPVVPVSTKTEVLAEGLTGMVKEESLKIPLEHSVKVMGLRVKSGEERFIVLCAIPLPTSEAKENGMKVSLQRFLEAQFQNSDTISHAEIFDSLTRQEYERLAAGADHHWQGKVGPVECLISLSSDAGPAEVLEAHPLGEGLCIPLENWLTQGSLAFPIYHWLERNKKKIRYAKAGRKFDSTFFERFSKRGVPYLLILQSDLDRYEIIRELCARAA